MVKFIEQTAAELPDPPPGKVWNTFPPHARYMDDPFYYDTLGRDPFDQVKFWKISEPSVRAEKFEAILEEHRQHRKEEYTDDHMEDLHHRQMMFTAVVKGAEDVLRTLIKIGTKAHPEPNTDDDQSCVPIHAAANNGQLGCVKILVEEAGVSVEAKNESAESPLLIAALAGDVDIVRYLLGEGADPRVRIDPDSEVTREYIAPEWANANALELATWKGHFSVVKLLLEHPFYGSTRKRKNRDGEEDGIWVTPLALKGAAASRNFELFNFLLERGAYPMEERDGISKAEQLSDEERQAIKDALPQAAISGDIQTLKTVLSYFHPKDTKEVFRPFELRENLEFDFLEGAYNAAILDQTEKFEFLYSFGPKEPPNRSLNDLPEGMSLNLPRLLEIAAQNGALSMVKLLIDKYHIDPNAMRRPPAMTPLYLAAANDKSELVRYFLENHSIDTHKGHGRFITGPTPLWVAVSVYSAESAIILLQHGGPVEHVDKELLEIDKPTKAVLIETVASRAPVRLITEANAEGEPYKDEGYSRSILLELDPETDMEWLRNLQQRKTDAQLLEEEKASREREGDDRVRDLNREEEEKLGHPREDELSKDGTSNEVKGRRRNNPEFPTIGEREARMIDTDWQAGLIFHEPGK